MQITISQHICLAENKGFYGKTIYKQFDSNFIARIGDSLSDALWKNPYEYKVVDVVVDYSNETCFLTLEPYIVLEKEYIDKVFELACNHHNWSDRP